MLRFKRHCARLAGLASLSFAITLPAPAADTTWTGAANNNLWADPANWSAGLPDAATNAIVPANTPADFTIDLGGINRPAASISITGGTSTVHLVNGVPLAAGLLTLTGGGKLSLDTANTYAGGTRVESGTLIAATPGALGIGNVTFPDSNFLRLAAPNTTWQNQIAFNGTTFGLTVPAAGVTTLTKAPTGNGALWFGGNLRITGDGTPADAYSLLFTGGTLLVDGALSSPKVRISNGINPYPGPWRLGGKGSIAGEVYLMQGAVVNPGDDGFAPARLTAGNVWLDGGALHVDLAGTTPGTTYDQLVVKTALKFGSNGFPTPVNPRLEVFLGPGYTPPLGTVFTIVDNQFTGPVQGTFIAPDFAEGSVFPATNAPTLFRISYLGGDGNDITLTTVPEPTLTLPLLLAPLLRARRARRAKRLTAK